MRMLELMDRLWRGQIELTAIAKAQQTQLDAISCKLVQIEAMGQTTHEQVGLAWDVFQCIKDIPQCNKVHTEALTTFLDALHDMEEDLRKQHNQANLYSLQEEIHKLAEHMKQGLYDMTAQLTETEDDDSVTGNIVTLHDKLNCMQCSLMSIHNNIIKERSPHELPVAQTIHGKLDVLVQCITGTVLDARQSGDDTENGSAGDATERTGSTSADTGSTPTVWSQDARSVDAISRAQIHVNALD